MLRSGRNGPSNGRRRSMMWLDDHGAYPRALTPDGKFNLMVVQVKMMAVRSPSLRRRSVAMAHYAEGRTRPMHQRTTEAVTVKVRLLSAFPLTTRFKRNYDSSRVSFGCLAHGSRWMHLWSCPRHQMPARGLQCSVRRATFAFVPILVARLGCSRQACASYSASTS